MREPVEGAGTVPNDANPQFQYGWQGQKPPSNDNGIRWIPKLPTPAMPQANPSTVWGSPDPYTLPPQRPGWAPFLRPDVFERVRATTEFTKDPALGWNVAVVDLGDEGRTAKIRDDGMVIWSRWSM